LCPRFTPFSYISEGILPQESLLLEPGGEFSIRSFYVLSAPNREPLRIYFCSTLRSDFRVSLFFFIDLRPTRLGLSLWLLFPSLTASCVVEPVMFHRALFHLRAEPSSPPDVTRVFCPLHELDSIIRPLSSLFVVSCAYFPYQPSFVFPRRLLDPDCPVPLGASCASM